jgi:hypothetical protein
MLYDLSSLHSELTVRFTEFLQHGAATSYYHLDVMSLINPTRFSLFLQL